MPSATIEEPSSTLPPGSVFDIVPALLEKLSALVAEDKPDAVKDLPSQLSTVKQRIAAARATIVELPDIDRTPEEQEAEIKELEERIEKLKLAWARVGDGFKAHSS